MSPRSIAWALARALHTSDWSARALHAAARSALEERRRRRRLGEPAHPRWLARLVRQVRRLHRRKPRVERLASTLRPLVERILARSTARSDRLRVVRPLFTRKFPVPTLAHRTELAAWLGVSDVHLDWFADLRGTTPDARDDGLRHYRTAWIPKSRGGARLLEAPLPRLRALQRHILSELLDRVPVHPAAHGFVRGRSVRSFAAPHAGKAVVLRLDLEDFFASIGRARVHAIFVAMGYDDRVARSLAGLATTRTPARVLASAPAAFRADPWAFHRRSRLRERHLPQGAPTSPALANLAARPLDVRLHALARAAGADYTRYADDLVFSGGRTLARRASAFIVRVMVIALEEGFRVNARKTRVMHASTRQHMTGLVVNAHPQPPRADYDALRALLHNCARFGPRSQNTAAHADFQAHLAGRVAWHSATPSRADTLRKLLARIDFSEVT